RLLSKPALLLAKGSTLERSDAERPPNGIARRVKFGSLEEDFQQRRLGGVLGISSVWQEMAAQSDDGRLKRCKDPLKAARSPSAKRTMRPCTPWRSWLFTRLDVLSPPTAETNSRPSSAKRR